jgi:glycerophosphoryl diester phosphodiesterase
MTLAEIRRLDAGSWFDSKFAGEKVPTIDEVLALVAEYRQHDVLIAVDLKSANVGPDVVRLAGKHGVLHRLLFIGRTISEPDLREQIKAASSESQTAAVANNSEEFPTALAAPHADWVYVRFLPTAQQIDAVHRAGKRAFIAGPTVAGNLPTNWNRAASVGLDGILTDYPLELRSSD